MAEAEDPGYIVFNTVEILQNIARYLFTRKDLTNLSKISVAAKEAVVWERSLRSNWEPKVVFLGQHGPLPNFNKEALAHLIVSRRLTEADLPYIKTIFEEATRNSKKLLLEFPYKYPTMDRPMRNFFKQIKHPLELKIAEKDLFRTKRSKLRFDTADSIIITFNRILYIGLEVLSYNPDEWNLDVIKAVVPLEKLKQFTATSSVTKEMFLRRNFLQLRALSNITDLTVDEFEHPLVTLDKSTFPNLTRLKLVDPIVCDNIEQTSEGLKRAGYNPCSVKNLTIEYRKSKHPLAEFADLMVIFPELDDITIMGDYLPYGVFSVTMHSLTIPKLRLLGSVIFGSLTKIMKGNKTFKGIRLLKELTFLELGTRSTYKEDHEVIADCLSELKALEKIYLHPQKLKKPILQILTERFRCYEVISKSEIDY